MNCELHIARMRECPNEECHRSYHSEYERCEKAEKFLALFIEKGIIPRKGEVLLFFEVADTDISLIVDEVYYHISESGKTKGSPSVKIFAIESYDTSDPWYDHDVDNCIKPK